MKPNAYTDGLATIAAAIAIVAAGFLFSGMNGDAGRQQVEADWSEPLAALTPDTRRSDG